MGRDAQAVTFFAPPAELRAERKETRRRRLATLVERCANGRLVRQFAPRGR